MSKNHEHWGSRLGFILAAAGSAIGLGTLWMLPFVVGQNGGGAFFLLFLAFTLILGIPLFIAELVLGRASRRSVVGAFAYFSAKDSSWPIIGWIGILSITLVAGWYSVVAGWSINYIMLALTDSFKSRTLIDISQIFETIQSSGDLNLTWQALLLVITFSIISRGVKNGIEKFSKLLMSILFVTVIGLFLYSSQLSGFAKAVDYILVPHFELLTRHGILKALGMSLFTLSLGQGIMLTFGSYLDSGVNLAKTSLIVTFSVIFIAVLVSLMIFPMVFSFGFSPEAGEGLVYKILPYVFEQLPGSLIISLLFFLLLAFAALTSIIGQIETLVANFVDLKDWSRKKASAIVCLIVFIFGVPTALSFSEVPAVFAKWPQIFGISFLDTNYVVIEWLLAIFSLYLAFFVGFKMPRSIVAREFTSEKVFAFWYWSLRVLVPLGICVVILARAQLI